MAHIPMFSIIVPIYNVGGYLEQCILSILNQDYDNFELILVDDGSPDTSPEICDSYAKEDKRIRVIHKSNGGLVSARKAGTLAATGVYVLSVDGDDYVEASWLNDYAKVASKYSPDCIASGFKRVYENGYIDEYVNDAKEGLYANERMKEIYDSALFDLKKKCLNMGGIIYSLCCKCFKREILLSAQMNVPETICNGEDVAVVFPALCKCGSIYVMNSTDYCYRQNMQSMTHTVRMNEFERQTDLYLHLSDKLPCISNEQVKAYIAGQVYSNIVNAAKCISNLGEFCKYGHEHISMDLHRTLDAISIKRWDKYQATIIWTLKHKRYRMLWMLVQMMRIAKKLGINRKVCEQKK